MVLTANYWKVTDPVRNFYKEKGSYVEIDASKDIQEVYDIFIATQHEKSVGTVVKNRKVNY